MKRALLVYFVLINTFCFVVTATDLTLPWIGDAEELSIGVVTASALGGSGGSLGALALAEVSDGDHNESLRRSLLVLVVQNLIGYGLVLGLIRRAPKKAARSDRRGREENGETDASSESGWNNVSA